MEKFHEIQREQHPNVRSVTAAVFDAALNWREAYMEYIPNYPIAAYRIDDEMANNPAFQTFVDVWIHSSFSVCQALIVSCFSNVFDIPMPISWM